MGRTWSDGSNPIVTDLQTGDIVALLRASLGASGSVFIDIDDFANELVSRITEMVVDKLTITTQIIPPIDEVTFSGDVTLVAGSSKTELFFNDGGADRVLTMPADAVQGWFFKHTVGSNTITIKTAGGSTITTLAPGEGKTVVYSGSRWDWY